MEVVLEETGVVGEYLEEEPCLVGDCLEETVLVKEFAALYLEDEEGGESLSKRRLRGEVRVCCAGRRRRAWEA